MASVDWLLEMEGVAATVPAVRAGLLRWPAGAGDRKSRIFDDRVVGIALARLAEF